MALSMAFLRENKKENVTTKYSQVNIDLEPLPFKSGTLLSELPGIYAIPNQNIESNLYQ